MPTPASPRFTLLTASLVCALIILDTNIVAVSLPSIARDLSGSFADIEWVVSAYLLAFAACLLPDTGARNIDSLLNQQILPVLSQQLLQRQQYISCQQAALAPFSAKLVCSAAMQPPAHSGSVKTA